MRALAVVMVNERAEHSLEVSPIEDQKPVEALAADGAYEALSDGIRLRCAHG